MSDFLPVEMDVPQGSIVGPFMFIVYINDLVTEFGHDNSEITLYVDDTLMYTCDVNVECATKRNQASIDILYNWCTLNTLSINTGKTKNMIVKSNTVNVDSDISKINIANDTLENVPVYNYLGILIDDDLNFCQFVDDKYDK